MKVLLILKDLYLDTGGGQTVYRKIIESHPSIQFTYFRHNEGADAIRPTNTETIMLSPRREIVTEQIATFPRYAMKSLREADAYAASVAGRSYDVVECPDYSTHGAFISDACFHHGVKVGGFVLAMHGNISTTLDLAWDTNGSNSLEQRILETRQFEKANAVYSISRRYIKEWTREVDREVYYVDPAHFVSSPDIVSNWSPQGRPSLLCVGRLERRKGNDLFIELIKWLDAKNFFSAVHIGADEIWGRVKSSDRLRQIAETRDVHFVYEGEYDSHELHAMFRKPSLVIIPTRYDTLNLVALEALFSGCPVVVSDKAGVCDYLDETHPHLPYFKLNLDNLISTVPALNLLLSEYDTERQHLHQSLQTYPPLPRDPLDMEPFYRNAATSGPITSKPYLIYRGRRSYSPRASTVGISLTRALEQTVQKPLKRARQNLSQKIFEQGPLLSRRYFSFCKAAVFSSSFLRELNNMPERNDDDCRRKLEKLYSRLGKPAYQRCNFWMEIARLERLLRHDLVAASYELRVLRLLGYDPANLSGRLQDTLYQHSFSNEAHVVNLLYTDPLSAPEKVNDFLISRFEALRHSAPKPWAFVKDRRAGHARVAIIVSLYKAASKLRQFLDALSQQSMVLRGEAEIILVDSGSPTDEHCVIQTFLTTKSLNFVYARSEERETIQSAWNRGIHLSRAPYLVFLGVDETLYPNALDVLAGELDRNQDIDWVMANSLVTEVEESGLHHRDIMMYDRTNATKDHVYLETCYLSWVGGMYRRNVHDRFGYYDETFRAAGDTEFKNRVLHRINVKFISGVLGLFWNYPDGQTTASPVAEIEDSRAWYLFRTQGGVKYIFENRSQEEIEAVLRLCTGYRKSFCSHHSTDFELGVLIANHLARSGSSLGAELKEGFAEMRNQLRALEFNDKRLNTSSLISNLYGAAKTAREAQAAHEKSLKLSAATLNYKILNDNRYEQHSWLWKTF